MGIDKTFRTFHFGAASMLRFCLGPESHITTELEINKRIFYTFTNHEGVCEKLTAVFFSEEGMAVDDARALIESTRDIKRSMSACIKSPDGVWTNPLLLQQTQTEVTA